MTARKIITWPDQKLLKKAERITTFNDQTRQLAQDLYDTMLVSFGAGLAATQVDIQLAMCVVEKSYLPSVSLDPILKDCVVLINPEFDLVGKERYAWVEGCLSVPSITAKVTRHDVVNLRYQDLSGAVHECCLKGSESATVQHESDHLVGKLFIDRLKGDIKRAVRRKLKEILQPPKPKIKKEIEDDEEEQEEDQPTCYRKKVRAKRPKTFGKFKKRKKK